MEAMDCQSCVILGIKVKPGPIERYKIENFTLDNTVDTLKSEAEKKTNVPSTSLELIHHGKILKDNVTLQDSGVKSGEMVHVVKKKEPVPPTPPPTFTDAELQQLNSSLRTLGCTPNAPGWTRAMQLLNDESAMAEIMEHAPSLNDNCVTLSILHEVELLAALGGTLQTMRRGAEAHPHLVMALRHLMRLVRTRSTTATTDNAPTSGFAYSLEALSEDEDADEEEPEERNTITQEQFAVALQAAREAVFSGGAAGAGSAGGGSGAGAAGAGSAGGGSGAGAAAGGRQDGLLRLLRAAGEPATPSAQSGSTRPIITPEMFSEAITDAINRTGASSSTTPVEQTSAVPMEQSVTASSSSASSTSASPAAGTGVAGGGVGGAGGVAEGAGGAEGGYGAQLRAMHELGLLDDAINVRALLICGGDVNQAINLVFSGVIGED